MESTELVVGKIRKLRDVGIRIALDDFGTGYSSLAYLKTIPITTLKIDKLFVDDILNEKSDNNVTDSIIDLGHKMNLVMIAEGVETMAQLEYLRQNGCDKIQGYLFSRPILETEVETWLKEREEHRLLLMNDL